MPPLSTLNKTALTLAVTQAIAMSSAQAATIRVNDFGDDVNSTNCTLRQAIESANNDQTPEGSGCAAGTQGNSGTGFDFIIFGEVASSITLSNEALSISSNISIYGNGVTVNAAPDSRILDINNSVTAPIVRIDNMTLTGADVAGAYGAGLIINREANVTISNSTITGNTANLSGGGVAVLGGSTLTVVNSTISDNTVEVNESETQYSANRGGGIFVQSGSTLEIERSTLSGNSASSQGGGICNYGDATITNSTLSGNSSSTSGGGILNNDDASITITNTTLSGNDSFLGGGIFNSGDAGITNSTLSGNFSPGGGGGVFNNVEASITITNSTLSGNSNFDGGGGIANNGVANITNSTLSGNSSRRGGAIYNFGSASITNSTLSGNTANGDNGGGIFNRSEVTITNSTLSGNTADDSGGGIFNDAAATATISNSIISGNAINSTANRGTEIVGLRGNVLSNNVIGTSEHTTEQALSGVEPDDTNVLATNDGGMSRRLNQIIGPLRDNGGPTQTHALVFDSPALNAANNDECPDTDTDQRGLRRDDGLCDIGSFEAQANEAQSEEFFFVVPLPDGKSVIFSL